MRGNLDESFVESFETLGNEYLYSHFAARPAFVDLTQEARGRKSESAPGSPAN